MKLLYDLRATQSAIKGAEGGGEYSRAVFRRLVARDVQRQVAGYHDPAYPLDPEIAALAAAREVELVPVRDRRELQGVLASGRFAGFASGLPYLYYDLDFQGLAVFFTIHGLRPLEQPMIFEGRHYARGAAAGVKWLAKYLLEKVRPGWRRAQFQRLLEVRCRAMHVIVPSAHTRRSLQEHLALPATATVHEFYSPETPVCREREADPDILSGLGLEPDGYYFMVSGNRWIKNAWRGLVALDAILPQLPVAARLPVAVTGGLPNGLPPSARERCRATGYVSRLALATLYRGARAFIYPTLNEGFGYPPLEAMAQETPVICSSVTSIPEVVGEAGIYFDPNHPAAIRSCLQSALGDAELLREYARRGTERLAVVRQRQDDDLDAFCDLMLTGARAS